MRDERGGAIWGLLGAIGLVVVLMAILFSVCLANAGARPHSLGTVQLVSHQRDDCDPDWEPCDGGDYGGYHSDYGGGGNGNRGRRGDHQKSGRDSCHSFCGNTIIVPDPTKKNEPPPDEGGH